ncbi:hypothetical protein AVEN_213518-1 [Araneus ventricosus]|uniref:Uncharacterized protein n=1 Tax=Araneus ventricosus TaxID=182803 RepID=A0A4Y2SN85_ARAVE|nr:hypothetical protein AVEN_213518-1 [Araneus ventricosus]
MVCLRSNEFLLGKDEPNNTIYTQSGIVDFTSAEFQQKRSVLADEVLYIDTMMPELSYVPASTPQTPQSLLIKEKRHQRSSNRGNF